MNLTIFRSCVLPNFSTFYLQQHRYFYLLLLQWNDGKLIAWGHKRKFRNASFHTRIKIFPVYLNNRICNILLIVCCLKIWIERVLLFTNFETAYEKFRNNLLCMYVIIYPFITKTKNLNSFFKLVYTWLWRQ